MLDLSTFFDTIDYSLLIEKLTFLLVNLIQLLTGFVPSSLTVPNLFTLVVRTLTPLFHMEFSKVEYYCSSFQFLYLHVSPSSGPVT